MFIQFQKLSISNPSVSTPIIVNGESIIGIDNNNFEMNGVIVNASNIELNGNPKFKFYCPTPESTIQSNLNVIDVSSGYIPGSSCGLGNNVDVIYPSTSFPLIQLREIFNNTISESRTRIINPTHILYAENMIINDTATQSQQTVLMIIMSDLTRTRILSTLAFEDLVLILQPKVIL